MEEGFWRWIGAPARRTWHNVTVWRPLVVVIAAIGVGGLVADGDKQAVVGPGRCLEVSSPVTAEIEAHARRGVTVSDFVAVKADSTHFEQLFFISAKAATPGASVRTATWVADDINLVRRGPLPSAEPILLAANDLARDATPTLRGNKNSHLQRPDASSTAGKASQRCLHSGA